MFKRCSEWAEPVDCAKTQKTQQRKPVSKFLRMCLACWENMGSFVYSDGATGMLYPPQHAGLLIKPI